MSYPKPIAILLFSFLFILVGCEDKKSKNTKKDSIKISKQKKKNYQDSLRNAIQIPTGGKETGLDLASIETIEQEQLIPFLTNYGKENTENRATIYTRFGEIKIKLYEDTPLHRANFIRLAKMGYFSTTFFHRILDNFVVQGGNSDNIATQRVREKVGSFLIPNEIKPNHTHNRGAFSAAKYSEQNVSKASSPFEFFIVQGENTAHHLDNDHTVYGEVISGMNVVDEMAKVKTDQSEWPIRNIMIDSVVVE